MFTLISSFVPAGSPSSINMSEDNPETSTEKDSSKKEDVGPEIRVIKPEYQGLLPEDRGDSDEVSRQSQHEII